MIIASGWKQKTRICNDKSPSREFTKIYWKWLESPSKVVFIYWNFLIKNLVRPMLFLFNA